MAELKLRFHATVLKHLDAELQVHASTRANKVQAAFREWLAGLQQQFPDFEVLPGSVELIAADPPAED